jgi:hypothetical protein
MLDPELIRLAQAAWEATKDDSQPSWNECQPNHRQKYLTAAKAAIKTQVAQTPFEQKVLELSRQPMGVRVPATPRPFNESDYAKPHSEFVKDREESEPKPVLQHGDEEIAAAVGVKVDQHETEGAAKIGESPSDDSRTLRNSKPTPEDDAEVSAAAKRMQSKSASKKASSKKSSKKAKES